MESAYDKALNEVGSDGKFQKRFDILFNTIFTGFWMMAYMNIVLSLAVPSHSCAFPQKPENVSDEQWEKYYTQARTYNQSLYVNEDGCFLPGIENEHKACSEHVYNKTWYESTITSDNDWICDNKIYLANTFACIKIFETVGSVVFGWYGDMFGRRMPYILSLLSLIIGRCLSVIVAEKSYILFIFSCLLASFPSWTAFQSVAVISMEISSPRRRNIANSLRAMSCTTGMVVMPFFYWWLRDWKTFTIVTTLTQLPFLVLSCILIESPRWLWLEGKYKECVKVLKQIAKTNGTMLSQDTENDILEGSSSKNKSLLLGPLMLFSNRNVAVNSILLLSLWAFLSISYTVCILRVGDGADGNPFLQFAWQSSAEIPANLAGAWLTDRMGRRYSIFLGFMFSGGIWMLDAFRNTWRNSKFEYWRIETAILFSNRFFITVIYYVMSLLNMEIYPTCLRQSGIALSNVFSCIAAAVAPYFLVLSHQTSPIASNGIIVIMCFLSAIIAFLLPETFNVKLPETLEDTKHFGYFKFNYSPIIKRNDEVKNNSEHIDL